MSPQQMLEAERSWREGDSLTVGRTLFEAVAEPRRPAWAASVLRCALTRVADRSKRTGAIARLRDVLATLAGRNPLAPVEHVLLIAEDPARWAEAHEAFRAIRRQTLKFDTQRGREAADPREVSLVYVLALAELVAKVSYNATAPPDPFDEDSGWWIAKLMRDLARLREAPGFERDAWVALSRLSTTS